MSSEKFNANENKRIVSDRGVGDSDENTRFKVNLVPSITVNPDFLEDENYAELGHPVDLSPSSEFSESGTYNGKSFRHLTREVLPRLDNYRNIMSIQAAYRPTLDELHNAPLQDKRKKGSHQTCVSGNMEVITKFGWIQGVLIRNLLNIWGIMLFLRLTWVVGQAGIGQGLLIILATTAVTTITALSMSAICTNGIIKGGGIYYMISRSLGPEFGGSIGLILSLANVVACAMYVVGFSESLNELLQSHGIIISDSRVNDMRITGVITITLLLCIVILGLEWEAKTQLVLLFILVIAILDFMIGTIIGPQDDVSVAKGFLGYNRSLFMENLYADYRISEGVNHNFFSVFAIFFPAATGFLAGANISGDLEDPETAIPKGTFLSVLITSLSYIIVAFMAGATVARDASGIVDEVPEQTFLNCTYRKCDYGLMNSFTIVELVSAFGPIIYAGCFAASISSALASLVSAPKIFQAVCRDELYPYISWFGKGYGKNREPVRGYILTFFIAVAFILIGKLNAIAPLISNFFLAAYALINFSTFHASLVKPVGWRPKFRYYNIWICLLGSMLCISVMFLISWSTALITLACLMALYLVVAYRKPDVNWGSSTQAQTYNNALTSAQQLNTVLEHVKNYRPQILVLSGLPGHRPPLVHFAHTITKNLSLMICGHIIKDALNQRAHDLLMYESHNWLNSHNIKAFYTYIDEANFEDGAKALIQSTGVGKLKPNILLMGYKADWQNCQMHELAMYFSVIHKALDMYVAVCILRLRSGLDYSSFKSPAVSDGIISNVPHISSSMLHEKILDTLPYKFSFSHSSQASSMTELAEHFRTCSIGTCLDVTDYPLSLNEVPESSAVPIGDSTSQCTGRSNSDIRRDSVVDTCRQLPEEMLENLSLFQRNQKNGTLDVWWLYDDGGLTLLLPYIISTRSSWSSCKLRVFALANKKAELEYEQRSMASLLAKFRIDYSDVKVIPDITKKPNESTYTFFNDLINSFKSHNGKECPGGDSVSITDAELSAMMDKTNRHLRLRELVLEHSNNANLVVMTLPMPRKNAVSAALYMAWLEALTNNMPPFLLVRGNQTSVLTFYS